MEGRDCAKHRSPSPCSSPTNPSSSGTRKDGTHRWRSWCCSQHQAGAAGMDGRRGGPTGCRAPTWDAEHPHGMLSTHPVGSWSHRHFQRVFWFPGHRRRCLRIQRCVGAGSGHALPSLNLSLTINNEGRRLQNPDGAEGYFLGWIGRRGRASSRPAASCSPAAAGASIAPAGWGHKQPQHQTPQNTGKK